MDLLDRLSSHDLIISLRGDICPSCGRKKTLHQSFCKKCYFALPPQSKRDLYRRFEDGYADFWREAMRTLHARQRADDRSRLLLVYFEDGRVAFAPGCSSKAGELTVDFYALVASVGLSDTPDNRLDALRAAVAIADDARLFPRADRLLETLGLDRQPIEEPVGSHA